jgi:hypothetical protein
MAEPSFAEIAALEQPPAEPAPQAPQGPTQRMYDGDGAAVEVPLNQVKDAYASGYGFGDGDTVHLQQGGEVKALSGAEAGRLLDSPVGKVVGVAGADQYAAQEEAKSYDTVLEKTRAFGAGVLRGGTFGASDKLLVESGLADRQDLQNLQKYNAGYGTAGELGSLLIPGAAPSVIGKVGRAASLATEARLGAGLLGRAAGSAVAGGIEVGAMTAGQEYSRQVLANEGLSGEKLASAFAHGAMFGAAGGAGLTVAGAGLTSLAGKGLDTATSLAERLSGTTAKVSAEEAATLGQKGARLVDAVSGGAEKAAVDKALRSTGATQKMIGDLEAMGEATRQRAAKQLAEGEAILGRPIRSAADAAEAAQLTRAKAGDQIGKALEELDAAVASGTAKTTPDVARIVDKARTTLVADLKASSFTRTQGEALEKIVKDFAESTPAPSLGALHKERRALDDLINFNSRNPTIKDSALRDFRGMIEQEIERVADKVSAEAGSKASASYVAAKAEYRAAKWVEAATEKGLEKAGANRSIGLSEQLGALGGGNLGGDIGSAIAGMPGKVVGNLVGAGVGAVAQNLIRVHGDRVASAILRRTAQTGDVLSAAVKSVDDVAGGRVAGLLKASKEAGANVARAAERTAEVAVAERVRQPTPEAFKASRAQVQAAVANPQAHAAQIAAGLPPGTPPGIVAAATSTAQRGASYLAATMPKGAGAGNSLQPQFDKTLPSKAEMATWYERLHVVADPTSVLESAARGKVTQAQADTLRMVYPEMFASLRSQVQEGLGKMSEPVSYQQALALGRLFDVTAHPSQKPAFIAAVQQALTTPPAQTTPPASMARREIKISSAYALTREEA